jgi:hypothetical protein
VVFLLLFNGFSLSIFFFLFSTRAYWQAKPAEMQAFVSGFTWAYILDWLFFLKRTDGFPFVS